MSVDKGAQQVPCWRGALAGGAETTGVQPSKSREEGWEGRLLGGSERDRKGEQSYTRRTLVAKLQWAEDPPEGFC